MKAKSDWYRDFYDDLLTDLTINSRKMHLCAKKETSFILKKMKLKRGADILDVPCGVARHSKILVGKGYSITGIDINERVLRRAKRNCRAKNAKFVRADMADLFKFRGKYDALINLFTSIGYFPSDRENERVIKNLVSCLKSGGKLAMSLVNRDWLMKNFRTNEWFDQGTHYLLEERAYDLASKYITANWVIISKKNGKMGRYHLKLRLYSVPELQKTLKAFGIGKLRVYGNFDGARFNRYKHSHPVLIGEKS